MHRTKTLIFGVISSGLMKLEWNCLAIMTIITFGGKRKRLASLHHPNCEAQEWQHHVVGVFCCRRDWWTSKNGRHHEERTWCGNTEATSQDISQTLEDKWVFRMDNDPKHSTNLVTKWLKDNKVTVLEGHHNALPSILYKNLKKACARKAAYKADSVTAVLSGGMDQSSSNPLTEACGRIPKTFDPRHTV